MVMTLWTSTFLRDSPHTELFRYRLLCQPCTNNTEIAGIILVGKEHRSHKKAIFHEKIFNFAQKHFDFLSSKLSRQQPSCRLGKLFQLCFIVAESQIDQSLPRGKLRATFILFDFQFAHVPHLWVSSREQWAGQEGKVGSPSGSCWSSGGQVLAPPTPKRCGNHELISPGTHYQEPPGEQPENFPPEVTFVFDIPFAIFTST